MRQQLAATTYVQITRSELEEWLNTLPLAKHWLLRPGSVGIYLLPVGDNVAVKLSSTIGSRDDAVRRGEASMNLALISLVTGQLLNKKAQGQKHFARTLGWRKNWREGFDRVAEAYQKSRGFYDALALIENRATYERDMLNRIEALPDWQNHSILSDFYTRVKAGGILTTAQVELIIREEKKPKPSATTEELLQRMRELLTAARRANDQWLIEFLNSVGPQVKVGRPLTEKQQAVLDKNLHRYRI
jgi:hypothetical protein